MDASDEGAPVDVQNPRVREVFKYLPDWAPKSDTADDAAATISPDITLNALAQLIALRLDVDRSLISFLDGEEQYVLAEATKSSSLHKGRPVKKADDELLTGMRTIPSGQGLCYRALSEVPAGGIFVVEDIHKNQDFCFRPFAVSAPHVKFYAACPIVINDQKVGIVCVINEETRPTFTTEEIEFLGDVTSSVALHLESVRRRRTQDRTADIVSALDAVMRPGRRNPSFRTSTRKKRALPRVRQKLAVIKEFGGKAESIKPELPLAVAKDERDKEQEEEEERLAAQASSKERVMSPETISTNFLEYGGSLLVDGFDADGVVFYAAGSRNYIKASSRRGTAYSRSSTESPGSPVADNFGAYSLDENTTKDSPACNILAFSSGKSQEDCPPAMSLLQEKHLKDLFEAFPSGQILHLGDVEISTDGNDEQTEQAPWAGLGLGRMAKSLQQAIPEAQSIAFFPMWDHFRDRWYAGGIIYSNDAKRLIFSNEDLNFLRAFALVLTGELASRDRERSQNQKETFISMISHELRTPLHGILSNVDLMRDIGLTTFQTTLLDTISACGHSLMDIINHLIDRSTMVANDENFKKHTQMALKHQRAPLRRTVSYDKLEEVDLVIITEEVISALAVEMHLRTEARQGYEAAMMSTNSIEAQDLLPSNAVIVYDIHPQHDWMVRVRKGAFRRLLANLTSNAIKFTREGTIQIALYREDPAKDSTTCTITLEVTDTGLGISPDFLQYHLFQQFQQENSRTIGSGLGLFIVKSMADELEGEIDIKSVKGEGTHVTISFPCELISSRAENQPTESTTYADPVLQRVKTVADRIVVCFVSTQHDEREEEQKTALNHSRDSIANVCKNWFGIKVETSAKLRAGPGVVNIVDESFLDSRPFDAILADMARDLIYTVDGKTRTSPVAFIGTVNFTAALQSQPGFEAKENMFSITNPCGPHQLSRVLTSCMKLMLDGFSTKDDPSLSAELGESIKTMNISEPPKKNDAQSTRSVALAAQPNVLAASAAAEPAVIELPPNATHETSTNTASQDWHRKPHMLLVEDNAINMKVLERLCQRLSLTYALAFNGLEAVKLFEADPNAFDIVWMDIMMPVMDGMVATQQIREIEEKTGRANSATRARVIALTGLSGEDVEGDAESVGFDAFWTKPVKLDLLKKEIEHWELLREKCNE